MLYVWFLLQGKQMKNKKKQNKNKINIGNILGPKN